MGSGKASVSASGPARSYVAVGDRLQLGLLVVLIVGVPTVFLRKSFSTFDIPQVSIFWLLAVAVAFVGIYRIAVSGVVERGPHVLTFASVCFLGALALTSALSSQPWVAFSGLPVRGAGALTYALCLGLLHSVYRLGRRQPLHAVVLAFVCAHGVVAGYALLQAYGLDPFVWNTGPLYVGPVFSTLGNPNFSSAYLGLTLPLLVWVPFGSHLTDSIRVIAGAAVGASSVALAYLSSLQGNLAALTAVVVLGHWAWERFQKGRLLESLATVPPALVIVGTPFFLETVSGWLLLAAVVVLGACTSLGILLERRNPVASDSEQRGSATEVLNASAVVGRVWIWLAVAAAAVAAGALLFGGRIVNEFESRFEQRIALWKTSLSIFASNPIMGTGLETYPEHFTAHRPLSHAMRHEAVLADSPHSVHLGLLSGGGLVLSVTYVVLMVVMGWAGVRAVKWNVGSERLFYGAVLAAWTGYHLQSSVSMDVPGLAHTYWVLGGVLLAGGVAGDSKRSLLPWAKERDLSSRSSSSVGVTRWRTLGAAVPVLLLLLLIDPLTAPLRADMAAYRAQQALDRLDYQAAGDELLRAIDLQPRNGLYAEGMALVYEESGLYPQAFEERVRSARLRPGNAYAALSAGRSAAGMGRLGDAEDWYRLSAIYEPNGAMVLAESAAFLSKVGRVERARELLDVFESLQSTNLPAWESAWDAYQTLGELEKAERANLCSIHTQKGCWNHGG